MIKGFFFDLDGTLVNTHSANFEAYRLALKDYGVTINFEQFKETIGHSAKAFLPILAPNLSDVELEDITEKKRIYYRQVSHLSVLNNYLANFLRQIKDENLTVLVTTAKRENAETILRHHNLLSQFNYIITAEDVTSPKPSPEAYELALKKTGLKPNEVVAFEDSSPGAEAAANAGIAVIRVKDFIV